MSLRRHTALVASAAAALTLGAASAAASARPHRASLDTSARSTSAAARPGGFTFSTFEPAGLATFGGGQGGGKVGTRCPGAGPKKCFNTAAEPSIRADAAGDFYAASENGLGSGTEAWRSTDGGRHYVTLPSPDRGAKGNDSGVEPGGGDVDVAVGIRRNSSHHFPLYVSSLNLANVDVSTSQNGGKSFTLNPAAAKLVGDDREWIAADSSRQGSLGLPIEGGRKVCISYHDTVQNISVDCDYTGGALFEQHSSAIDGAHAPYLVGDNEIGNLAIAHPVHAGDRVKGNHDIYQIFSGPRNLAGDTACGGSTCYNVVYMAVSKDGGQTFTDHVVHRSQDIHRSWGHQFTNVAVDARGNVYAVYGDNHDIYYSFSKDQGKTWSPAHRVNKGIARTAIFPWATAGNGGKIDIVYYGSSHSPAKGQVPDTYPRSATWHVYLAQSRHALSSRPAFHQVVASPVNHRGAVCEGGVSCRGNRDLYDDFGVAASPRTGRASIVYSDDQFRRHHPRTPNPPGCTARTTNSASCDHTVFATQLSGPGIF
jgi:hypothetical protein